MQPNTVRGSEWKKENHLMFVSHCAEMSQYIGDVVQ